MVDGRIGLGAVAVPIADLGEPIRIVDVLAVLGEVGVAWRLVMSILPAVW